MTKQDTIKKAKEVYSQLSLEKKDAIAAGMGMCMILDRLLTHISDEVSCSEDTDDIIFLSKMKSYLIKFINTDKYASFLGIMDRRNNKK